MKSTKLAVPSRPMPPTKLPANDVVRLPDRRRNELAFLPAALEIVETPPSPTGRAIAAILIPAAFFLSVASPAATEPNGLINLAYAGALFLAGGVLSLGVGLIRAARAAR